MHQSMDNASLGFVRIVTVSGSGIENGTGIDIYTGDEVGIETRYFHIKDDETHSASTWAKPGRKGCEFAPDSKQRVVKKAVGKQPQSAGRRRRHSHAPSDHLEVVTFCVGVSSLARLRRPTTAGPGAAPSRNSGSRSAVVKRARPLADVILAMRYVNEGSAPPRV
ncbi:hypothetical protein EVAR_16716_1 [Eumeta japonica]|uniref:Uncharacterized protein n=1 Tax=Eumeta variegata TaxID=151549 RepID=A0A4C1V4E9_EUMVA|nr:hypothetical protein EVAR_16716_1 [Eumeta japonica]